MLIPRSRLKFYFFTSNRQEIKYPALYFLMRITELLPLNCSGKIQGLDWSTLWAENCFAKSPSQFLSVLFSCPRIFIPVEYFHPPCFLSYIQGRRLLFSALPEGSRKTAVNYCTQSHSDQQEVGAAIAGEKSSILLRTAHSVKE